MAPKIHPNDPPDTGTSAPTQDPAPAVTADVVAADLATTDMVTTDMVVEDGETISAAVPAG
jgi:hypothetical protein